MAFFAASSRSVNMSRDRNKLHRAKVELSSHIMSSVNFINNLCLRQEAGDGQGTCYK